MSNPTVSIGMPVYNGQRHLALAIEAVRAQTFRDFELIICDNASTDATEQISREFAAKDARIRYFRNEKNLGAARNFNRAFELTTGKYFKWAAHDDLIAPTYLERCVAKLEASPDAVLCFPRRHYITYEDGQITGSPFQSAPWQNEWLESFDGLTFRQLLHMGTSWCPILVFGLMRSDGLRRTSLIGPYVASDLVLVGEMRLLGRFEHVPEELYFQRMHPPSGWTLRKTKRDEAVWFDPNNCKGILLPRVRLYWEYLKGAHRCADGIAARWAAYAHILGRAARGLRPQGLMNRVQTTLRQAFDLQKQGQT
jgi:glycosyltransferase involved in cell wall biosynthesis